MSKKYAIRYKLYRDTKVMTNRNRPNIATMKSQKISIWEDSSTNPFLILVCLYAKNPDLKIRVL